MTIQTLESLWRVLLCACACARVRVRVRVHVHVHVRTRVHHPPVASVKTMLPLMSRLQLHYKACT